MSDVSDEQLDDETRSARQNYRKLAQQWVDDEDARVVKLAQQIHDAADEYYQKLSAAADNAEQDMSQKLKSMAAKVSEGLTVWGQRLERLKGEGEADPTL